MAESNGQDRASESNRDDWTHDARNLAAAVGTIDGLARLPRLQATKTLQAFRSLADNFLAAFRAALQSVVPRLPSLKQSQPVQHAGVAGTSYHQVTCRIALIQYYEMWRLAQAANWPPAAFSRFGEFDGITGDEVSAGSVIENWDAIAEELANQFDDRIDGKFLYAGIECESIIQTKALTRPVTKAEFAHAHAKCNVSNPTEYLASKIASGVVTAPIGKGKSWQFVLTDVPESSRADFS